MSKSVTPNSPASSVTQSNSAGGVVANSYLNQTSSTDNDMKQIADRAGNLPYGVGHALRKSWDEGFLGSAASVVNKSVIGQVARGVGNIAATIWSKLPSVSLPAAEAAHSQYDENHITPDLEALIMGTNFSFVDDEVLYTNVLGSDSDSIYKQKLINNVRDGMRKAVMQGPKTEDLIRKCLGNISNIAILDPRYAAPSVLEMLSSAGINRASHQALLMPFMHNDEKQYSIMLFNHMDCSRYVGQIIHECGHFIEMLENVAYDEKLLNKCVKNLKELQIGIIQCLNGRDYTDGVRTCDNIRDFVGKAWRDLSPNADGRGFIGKAWGDLSPNAEAFSEIYGSIVEVKLEDKTKVLVRFAESESELSAMILHKVQGVGGSWDNPTQDQIDYFNAVMNLEDVRGRESFPEHQALREVHAHIKNSVPEEVLDQVCPDGFTKQSSSPEPIVENSKATKIVSGKNNEKEL